MNRVVVINGPNLDLLGVREPERYGTTTLPELDARVVDWGKELGLEVETFQSNHEGALIDRIHDARTTADGIVINAAALTHYSSALADALRSVSLPVVEVHISNIFEREAWRRQSVVTPLASTSIYGRGSDGYRWALKHLVNRSQAAFTTIPYGSLPDQVGDLRIAAGGTRALAILIHGGLWRHEWTRDITEGLAVDLVARGYATWNLEYRRLGRGGGWPESFGDIDAALAAAPGLTGFSPAHTVVIGHSAGGTMALLGARLRPALLVGLAPLTDLVGFKYEHGGEDPVARLLDGDQPPPSEYSPFHRLPLEVPTIIGVAERDRLVPVSELRRYEAAARTAGDEIELILGDLVHMALLEPSSSGWIAVADRIGSRISPL
jgi:3-dehydroquinate dehydratase-2